MPSVGSGTYSPGPNMGCSPQKKVRTGSVEAITCPGYSNLRIPATVSNILLDLYDTATRLIADAGAITVPTLLLGAGSDWVVKLSAQRRFFERLSSPVKSMTVLPGFYHTIFHEKERHLAVAKVREFIHQCFASPPQTPAWLDADQHGYTKEEYDRLMTPGGLSF